MKRCLFLLMFFSVLLAGPDNNLRFIVVGDRTGACVPGVFDEIIDEVKILDPDFVMCVGDLIHGYTGDTMAIHAQWDTVLSMTQKLSCPFYPVAGNHDILNETDRRIYEQRTGFKRYYSFDKENNHFVILDNTMTYWSPPQEMDEEQLDWLRQDFEKHKDAGNIFLFYHIPTYLYALRDNTSDHLVELFEKYGVRVVFTGHHHTYSYINLNDTEYINVGSSGGGMGTNDPARGHFYHYLMVTVRGKENEIAVIKKGNVFLRNIVTADDLRRIDIADTRAVSMGSCIARGESKKLSKDFVLTIENLGPDSITQPLVWSFDSTRYLITPAELPLKIASEEKREYRFELTIKDDSEIFPIPEYSLVYPFAYGKSCTLRNNLPVTRLKNVKRIKSVPALDGKLDDKIWKKIKPITRLGTYNGLSDTPVEKTEVYLCHDNENLYVGVRCFESDFSQLTANASERDGATYSDDNLWFFFDANLDKETYYQAIINSKGVTFDRLCSLEDGKSTKDITWNGPWDIASGRQDDAWVLEIRIPKKELEPFNEEQWGFNFRRLQTRVNDAAFWSIPFGHNPQNFGIIEFE